MLKGRVDSVGDGGCVGVGGELPPGVLAPKQDPQTLAQLAAGLGWSLPADVPIEELVFFIAIPICGLLTLEAVRRLLGTRRA